MRASLLILMILFSALSINAQDGVKVFRLGFTASIDKNLSSEAWAFDKYSGYYNEYDKFNYSVGLNLEYLLSKGFSLTTAVNYSNRDFTGTYYCGTCYFDVMPTPQDIDFRLIEVPLFLRYYYQPGKLGFFGEAGASNNFLLNEEEVAERSYAFGVRLGIGLSYEVIPEIVLQVFYNYTQGVTHLYDESDLKMKTSGFGIGVMKNL